MGRGVGGQCQAELGSASLPLHCFVCLEIWEEGSSLSPPPWDDAAAGSGPVTPGAAAHPPAGIRGTQ